MFNLMISSLVRMKVQLLVIAVVLLSTSIDCQEMMSNEIIPLGFNSSQTEPGFDCDGGIAGLLTKYLGQREVAPEKISLIICGSCIFNPDFNQRLANDITRTPVKVISLPNGALSPSDARIFDHTVLYYCQNGIPQVYYEEMLKYIEGIILIRPHILFTISKNVGTEVTKYASVQSCRISHDHRLIDKLYISKTQKKSLIPQNQMRLSGDLCDIKAGSLQTSGTIST